MSTVKAEFLADVVDGNRYFCNVKTLEFGKSEVDFLDVRFVNEDQESITVGLSKEDVEILKKLWFDELDSPVISDGRVYWIHDELLVITELDGERVLTIAANECQTFFDCLRESESLRESGELENL